MKIAILDGVMLNPGDLSWAELEGLGACRFYDRTGASEVADHAAGAEAVLTNKAPITAEAIAALPELKYIGVTATGYNIIDMDAARARGIAVTNVPGYSTDSVAQLTFALLLELTHRVGHHAQAVREGRWSQSPDFSFWDGSLIELSGLTLGIVGFGQIGQAVGRIGRAFGMKVQAYRRPRNGGDFEGVEFVDLETLLRTSDVVSLHSPLTPDTKGLINAGRLALMKPTAFLLNTSRGPLVVEADLAEALDGGRIAGAGLDVLSSEPPAVDNPLILAKNCFITPHIAWASTAARTRLMDVTVGNVRAFVEGRRENRID